MRLFHLRNLSKYLTHFNYPKPFEVRDDGFFYAPLSQPFIDFMSFDGKLKYRTPLPEPWMRLEKKEEEELNKYAGRNSHKIFERISNRLFNGEISMNIRLDQLSDEHLMLTYTPGIELDSSSGDFYRIYRIFEDSLQYVKTFNAVNTQLFEMEDGSLWFGFSNIKDSYFFHEDGKKYQIGIEPRVRKSDTSLSPVEQRKQSLITNKLELCLFIGTYDL